MAFRIVKQMYPAPSGSVSGSRTHADPWFAKRNVYIASSSDMQLWEFGTEAEAIANSLGHLAGFAPGIIGAPIGAAAKLSAIIKYGLVSDPQIRFSILMLLSSIEGILNPQDRFPIPNFVFLGASQVANTLLYELTFGA